jgi:hypothetical protein
MRSKMRLSLVEDSIICDLLSYRWTFLAPNDWDCPIGAAFTVPSVLPDLLDSKARSQNGISG